MEFIRDILFIVAVIGFGIWIRGRKWLETETERNEATKPPSTRQLRWDIRHMREDLHMLVLINYGLVFIVVFLVFYTIWKP